MQLTVRVGQSVSTIAQRYHTSVAAIVAANGLSDPDYIRIGQKLVIPSGKDKPTAPVAPPAHHEGYTGAHHPASTHARHEAQAPAAAPVLPRAAHQAPRTVRVAPTPRPAAPGRRSTLSSAEVDSLTRAVAAEARGESPSVWAAMAQTIINYARQTGSQISHLVRTSYLSSNFDGNRRFYSMPVSQIPNANGIRQAVLAAGEGKSVVGNRSHFYDTSIGTPSWGDRSSRVQVGHIVFLNSK